MGHARHYQGTKRNYRVREHQDEAWRNGQSVPSGGFDPDLGDVAALMEQEEALHTSCAGGPPLAAEPTRAEVEAKAAPIRAAAVPPPEPEPERKVPPSFQETLVFSGLKDVLELRGEFEEQLGLDMARAIVARRQAEHDELRVRLVLEQHRGRCVEPSGDILNESIGKRS